MLNSLVDGAAKTLENAADLYDEARRLHAAGALSRALLLHQISLEECAKVEMLGTFAVSTLLDFGDDLKKLTVAMSSHKAKNYTNAYLLPATKAEADAKRDKSWDKAIAAFKEQQASFHSASNDAKNASLYVDFKDGTFIAPKERITEAMVAEIAVRNEQFLASTHSRVQMLQRWVAHPEKVRDMLKWFHSRLEELVVTGGDAEDALARLMDEMLARAKQTGYSDAMTGGDG